MLELTTIFTPVDGSPKRTITLRISDVRLDSDGASWSVAVEILGFKDDDRVRLKQVDWTQAIVDGAQFIARRVNDKVENAGGGTLDPPIGTRHGELERVDAMVDTNARRRALGAVVELAMWPASSSAWIHPPALHPVRLGRLGRLGRRAGVARCRLRCRQNPP